MEFGKSCRVLAVQCTAGALQSDRHLPTYRLVVQTKTLAKHECVPANVAVNSVRARSWEFLRQRCVDPCCKLRPPPPARATDADEGEMSETKPPENDVEEDEVCKDELCHVTEEDQDDDDHPAPIPDEAGDSKDSKGTKSARVTKELYPFTRPIEQGKATP